jgi:glycosyltransferase involved in cell wall biosynthesis
MHWSMPLPLYARGVPNLYTIHDLIPLRLPHTTLHDRRAFMTLHEEVARRADRILVVSEATRQDVVKLLKVAEGRVFNTHQSISLPPQLTSRTDAETADEIERVFELEWKEYFLHFGAVEPKKNLGRIVEAYLSSGSATPLVLVGAPGWLHQSETALLEQVKRDRTRASDRIRRYEYTSQSLMISLIRGAKAVLFPSLYEGFGLPVLEAMTLSTAVLTSQAGALAEVAGSAALLVDPCDTQAIAAGIRALDADAGLISDLEARGRRQAARFTPERYRERLREAYAGF